MFGNTLTTSLLLLPSLLRLTLAQNSNSSGACNNSPALCSQSYSNITHLGAHNSPFVRDESTSFTDSGNQYYNSTAQLSAGVRLLSAQVQRANSSSGPLHVCHSSCDLLDAGTLSSWLGEIKTWTDANPNDVVTILLVNGAEAPASELASAYTDAAIPSTLTYTPSGSTASTQTWPTLQSLIDDGTRLLTFVAGLPDGDSASHPHLMDEWTYIFENDYDNNSPSEFSCTPSRPSSAAGDASSALADGMMAFMNHFLYQDAGFGIQSPDADAIDTTNSPGSGEGALGAAASECEGVYGRQPTFVLVDFFNVGPAIETVDRLNGVEGAVGRRSVVNGVPDQTGAGMRVGVPWVGVMAGVAAVCGGLGML